MEVRIKKLEESAVVPKYSKVGDAGLDLTATSMSENALYMEYGTSLAIEIPDGYVGLIFPRSSLSNYHLSMANAVGVIDCNYRGEIKFRFKKTLDKPYEKLYTIGERVGQLIIIPYPSIELVEAEELSESSRGALGFGSSGV